MKTTLTTIKVSSEFSPDPESLGAACPLAFVLILAQRKQNCKRTTLCAEDVLLFLRGCRDVSAERVSKTFTGNGFAI